MAENWAQKTAKITTPKLSSETALFLRLNALFWQYRESPATPLSLSVYVLTGDHHHNRNSFSHRLSTNRNGAKLHEIKLHVCHIAFGKQADSGASVHWPPSNRKSENLIAIIRCHLPRLRYFPLRTTKRTFNQEKELTFLPKSGPK